MSESLIASRRMNMSRGIKASRKGLEIVDRLIQARCWNRQCVRWAGKANVSVTSLKRFLRGSPISRELFKSICDALGVYWRDIVDYDSSTSEFLSPIKYWAGVPDISDFCGRTEDVNNVKKWIVNDKCRIIGIFGVVGIGKSAFAVKLATEIQAQFDYVIWLRPRQPLDECLTELFTFLRSNSNSDFPENMPNISDRISQLIRFLNSHSCLLLFDGLETTLRSGNHAGSYQDEYRSYSELFSRGAEELGQSCLIVTSREQPTEIDFSERRNNFVRSYHLKGLEEEAARELLKARNLSDEHQWQTLIRTYRGNPLYIKLVSPTIQEMFGGSIVDFLKQDTLVIESINPWIAQQLNRLQDLERKILDLLAQQQKPVSYARLIEMLQVSPQALLQALESLVKRRSLVEKSADGFTLQPVLMEYMTNINLSKS